jgi:hypothetical protein
MTYDHLREAALPRALSNAVADLADLVQKELRLAKAEVTAKITNKMMAGVWFAVAGLMGLIVLLLLLQALVFWIASFGFSMHASALMTAVLVAIVAGGAFLKGRADAAEDMTPERTIRQVRQDVATVQDRLS